MLSAAGDARRQRIGAPKALSTVSVLRGNVPREGVNLLLVGHAVLLGGLAGVNCGSRSLGILDNGATDDERIASPLGRDDVGCERRRGSAVRPDSRSSSVRGGCDAPEGCAGLWRCEPLRTEQMVDELDSSRVPLVAFLLTSPF